MLSSASFFSSFVSSKEGSEVSLGVSLFIMLLKLNTSSSLLNTGSSTFSSLSSEFNVNGNTLLSSDEPKISLIDDGSALLSLNIENGVSSFSSSTCSSVFSSSGVSSFLISLKTSPNGLETDSFASIRTSEIDFPSLLASR